MPILYEDTLQRKRANRKLDQILDSSFPLAILLAAGKGTLLTANAFDANGNPVTKAAPGVGVGFYASIKNDGDDDYLWCTLRDSDTGAVVIRKDGTPCQATIYIKKGLLWGWTAATASDLSMPNKTWNLVFRAGHGQA